MDKELDDLLFRNNIEAYKKYLDTSPDFLPTSRTPLVEVSSFILKWTHLILKANDVKIPSQATIMVVPAPNPFLGVAVYFGPDWGGRGDILYTIGIEDIWDLDSNGAPQVKSLDLFRRVYTTTKNAYQSLTAGATHE